MSDRAGVGQGAGRDKALHEGLEHLQHAARETIAAMRTLLDLAEDLVDDPKTSQHLITCFSSLAQAGRSGLDLGRARRSPEAGPAGEGNGSDGDGGDGVQRIPVS